jgi:hypothetical protein
MIDSGTAGSAVTMEARRILKQTGAKLRRTVRICLWGVPDMKQNAVIVAAFVYDPANRDEKLPRKPLPKPAVAPQRITTPAAP